MKLSNLMIASLGAVALMGCDDGDKTPTVPETPPPAALAFEEMYWDMETVPVNAMSTQALTTGITDKFKFEDNKLRVYTYVQTGTDGDEFTYTETSYTAGDEEVDGAGTVAFTHDSVAYDCDYTVASSSLNLDCNDGAAQFAGTEITDTDKIADLDNNSEPEDGGNPGDMPTPVNEFSFASGGLEDTGSAGNELRVEGDNVTVTATDGATGTNNAVDVNQSNGFGYLKYQASGSEGVNQIKDSFTLEAVFNRHSVASYANSDASLIEFADSGTSAGFKLSLGRPGETSNQAQFRIYGVDADKAPVSKELTTATTNSDYPIELNTWYHLTAVYNVSGENQTMQLYLNGELVNETSEITFTPTLNVDDTVSFMGGSTSQDKNIDGAADNFAIWNVALTAEQIAERAASFGFGEKEPEGAATVEEINDAIAAAADGDIITLSATGTFDSGVIELNKAVTLEGSDATITGSACIIASAPGATIQNLNFENNYLGWDGEDSTGTCAIGSSDGQAGAISISGDVGANEDDAAVKLNNITFDAVNTDEQDDFGAKKASWLFAYGRFELTNSTFLNLPSNMQNNGIFVNCGKSAGRRGSVISGNEFNNIAGGTSETGAIKIGDTQDGFIKTSGSNDICNVTVEENTFNGYKTLHTNNSNDVDGESPRTIAIFASLAETAVITAEDKKNILN